MGEYYSYKGAEFKAGVCDDLYQVRYEDRLDCSGYEEHRLSAVRFRLPFAEEDNFAPGCYPIWNRVIRLQETLPPVRELVERQMPAGKVQLSCKYAGFNVCVPCYHGYKLPEIEGLNFHWNGKRPHIYLHSVACREGRMLPVLLCAACSSLMRGTWEAVLPALDSCDKWTRRRLEEYAEPDFVEQFGKKNRTKSLHASSYAQRQRRKEEERQEREEALGELRRLEALGIAVASAKEDFE